MMRRCTIALAGLFLAFASAQSVLAQPTGEQQLFGWWQITSAVKAGEVKEELIGAKVHIEEGHLTAYLQVHGETQEVVHECVLDQTQTPHCIDLVRREQTSPTSEAIYRRVGIYQLEGDQLTVCMADEDALPRPAALEASEEASLIVLQRLDDDSEVKDEFLEALRETIEEAVYEALHERLEESLEAELEDVLEDASEEEIEEITEEITHEVIEEVTEEVAEDVVAMLLEAFDGEPAEYESTEYSEHEHDDDHHHHDHDH